MILDDIKKIFYFQSWYKQCYDTALNCLETEVSQTIKIREDRVHGGLLVMGELLRCANADWERINRDLEDSVGSNLRRPSTRYHILNTNYFKRFSPSQCSGEVVLIIVQCTYIWV